LRSKWENSCILHWIYIGYTIRIYLWLQNYKMTSPFIRFYKELTLMSKLPWGSIACNAYDMKPWDLLGLDSWAYKGFSWAFFPLDPHWEGLRHLSKWSKLSNICLYLYSKIYVHIVLHVLGLLLKSSTDFSIKICN
jgi:hypothetical protein